MPKRRRKSRRSASAMNSNDRPGQKRKVDESDNVGNNPTSNKRRHLSTPTNKSPRDEGTAHLKKAEREAPQKFEQSPSPSTTIAKNMSGNKDWNYDDDDTTCGPHCWTAPADGKQQSPIDLRLSTMKMIALKDPFQFINYDKPLSGEFINTGHSVQFVPNPTTDTPQIKGGMLDQTYKFIQYHYHWAQENNKGSEHALCGLRYPAELHLVHQGIDDPSKLAVLGIFLHLGSDHTALDSDCQVLSEIVESNQKSKNKSLVVLESKLPNLRDTFARYNGSLTTPPCSENVVWTVFTEPVEVTHEQLNILRSIKDYRGTIIDKNYRPLQNVNDRNVFLASC